MNKFFTRNRLLKFLSYTKSEWTFQETYWLNLNRRQYSNHSVYKNHVYENFYLKENKNKYENFKKLSNLINLLIDNLCDIKWIGRPNCNRKLTNKIELILKQNEFNPWLANVIKKIQKKKDFDSVNNYFLNNLDKLDLKEQAILFRFINFLNKNPNDPLILKLEQLYYNQLEYYDLNDFLNYNRGFYLLRPFGQSYSEPLSKSAEIVNKKIFNLIENLDKQSNEESSSLDRIFNEIELNSSGLQLIYTCIKFYLSNLTTECQSGYFKILLEKSKKINFSNENINDLAYLFILIETIFSRNDKNITKIMISDKNYDNFFNQNFELFSSNLINLMENFEIFEFFVFKFFIKISENNRKIKNIDQIIDCLNENLIDSKDNQSISKYVYSAHVIKSFLKSNSFNSHIIKEKCDKVLKSMDFFSVQDILRFIPEKFINQNIKCLDPYRILIKYVNDGIIQVNEQLIYLLTYHNRFLFNQKTLDHLKTTKLYPIYACLNFEHFLTNLPEIFLRFENNFDYLLIKNINMDPFYNNLKRLRKKDVIENQECIKKVYKKSFNDLFRKLTFNYYENKIKSISIAKLWNEKLIFDEFNYDYLGKRHVDNSLAFVSKLHDVLKINSNSNDYIDLSYFSLENFQTAILNLKQLFEKMKKDNKRDEYLYQLVNFVLKKLTIHLYGISRLFHRSNYYSPSLNKDLISLFLILCEIACDPFYEYKEEKLDRILIIYEYFFRFIKLYSYYDIDCKEANITDEQKNDLEFYLTKMYEKKRRFGQNEDKELTMLKIHDLICLNVINEEILEDFKSNFDAVYKKFEYTNKKFHLYTYRLIKLKCPDFDIGSKYNLNQKEYYLDRNKKYQNFLNIYGKYLNENPKFDQFTSTSNQYIIITVVFKIKNKFVQDFSIIFDKNGNPLKKDEQLDVENSIEIPIIIVENGYMFKNTNKIKKLHLNFVESMRNKFPSILLFENELYNKTVEEIKKLFEEKVIEALK